MGFNSVFKGLTLSALIYTSDHSFVFWSHRKDCKVRYGSRLAAHAALSALPLA